MKIAVTDTGSGIARQLAQALGATVRGRFVELPASKGGGYLTGFAWGSELRMMVRHYYLHEEVRLETTDVAERPEECGVFAARHFSPGGSGVRPGSAGTRQRVYLPARSVFGH